MAVFKTEKDVQQYLENIFTEYKFGCYGEKQAEACHLLGDYYEAIKRQYGEAREIYKKNCDNLQFARSCAKYGSYKIMGKTCEVNSDEGYKYAKKSCELGDGPGCTMAGILAVKGRDINVEDKDAEIKKGVQMLRTACLEKGEDKACFFLAGIYMTGIKDIVEKNFTEAFKASLKCCESGLNPHSCANVSQMYARGEGVEKNLELAKTYKQQASEQYRDIKYGKRNIDFQRGT